MKVTDVLGVARSNQAEIRRLVDTRPTCGCRCVVVLLKRERLSVDRAPVNAKCVY